MNNEKQSIEPCKRFIQCKRLLKFIDVAVIFWKMENAALSKFKMKQPVSCVEQYSVMNNKQLVTT